MEKIIYPFPLGSCSCTDMENYFRGSLNHKRYFVFFFFSASVSLTHTSFFHPSLSNSLSVSFILGREDIFRGLESALSESDLAGLSIPQRARGEKSI